MNYFLDTCVKIGYVFCTDPWNAKSESIFKKNATFYISRTVVKEFNKKYNDILKQQKNFFYSLRDELKGEDPSKKLSAKDLKIKSLIIPLKRNFSEDIKEQIAEVLWKHSKPKHKYDAALNKDICTVKDLLTYINKFIRSFEAKIIARLLNFQRKVIKSERNKKYADLNKKLLDEVDIHYPDNCIIIDAHDLSLKESIKLEFISADKKMIKKVNNIVDSLNIEKFHYLKEFF